MFTMDMKIAGFDDELNEAMKKEMVELQQTVNCDAYDGQWGGGTLKKWKKWKKEFSR